MTTRLSPKPDTKKESIIVDVEENTRASDLDNLGLPVSGTPERLKAERKLVRKLDSRLLPTVFVIFIMNYIDVEHAHLSKQRNGITTARLKGMQQDLGISGQYISAEICIDIQYATVIAVLYASYCPAQIPSNMVCYHRPSLYIGLCVILWGLTSALTGVTKNFAGILACRMFIGLPESAFYPGASYLLSRWYTKKELAFRLAILYSGLLISNAFGSLMAAGILANMEGKRGIRAWRWWLLPDYVRYLLSVAVAFSIQSYQPHNTSWISPNERRLALARISEDAGEADQDNAEDSPLKGLRMAISDPLVLIFTIQTVSQLLGLSFVNFFPTLTQTLGFSTTISLLLAAPPWVFASIACCLSAWHADRTGERFFHIAGWWWGVIVGFIIGLSTMKIPGRYVAMFLMASGYAGFAMTLVWVSNAIPRPPAKRAAAMGIVNGIGNLGNLIGSYTWKTEWGPEYHQSMAISLAALVFSTILAWVTRQMLIQKNNQLDADENAALKDADRARVEEAARLEGLTFQQAMERRKGYRYLY
ncbi:hypothetical protein J132_05082 [Termitomyces sp. J132]|nr:hypothetical protein J132_05082 [Termitomyces sp. J132]